MAGAGYTDERKAEIIKVFKKVQSIAGTARTLGIPNSRSSISTVIDEWQASPDGQAWSNGPEDAATSPLPPTTRPSGALGLFDPQATRRKAPSGRKTYILTSAQNNTKLHEGLWENLLALAEYEQARLIVGGLIYRKEAQGQASQEKKHKTKTENAVEWDKRLYPHLLDERLTLAPDLIWCGEMNILPTAERPLSGLDNYTGPKSAIFPHAKVALESIATNKRDPAKMNYTTGAVTEANYIQRKVGLKAEFHHILGALIVEVDEDGEWFVRQINASSDGSFYDLDRFVNEGRVTQGHNLEAINWGDIHEAQLEQWMREACWSQDGILDRMRPRYQFFHDLLDFNSRSHHDMKDPHEMYKKYATKKDSVKDELSSVISFLHFAERQYCQSVIVESNHDNAYLRWVKEATHKTDNPNATFLLKSQLACYEAMDAANDNFHLFGWALGHLGYTGSAIFLDEDDSFVICPTHGEGIECAMHGHLGLNGARGSAKGFTRMGRKLNIGHGHGAIIIDGVCMAGVQGNLDQGYNKGPSNWSHSMIFTYKNGKRAMVTMKGARWRGREVGLAA